MARQRRQTNSNRGTGQRSGVTYADVRYTDADQAAFSEWLETKDVTLESALEALTEELYRVTVKIDVNNNCRQASVTQQDEHKHKNSGVVLVVRASTDAKAIILAAWTIFEMYHSEPLPVERSSNDVWF